MSLYEIVDSSGRTVMELGRFKSDAEAVRASRNIKVSVVGAVVARKTDLGPKKVAPHPGPIPSKQKLLGDLLDLCISSNDDQIADLARMYRRSS